MGEAILSIGFAGPLVSLQDGGRPGHLRFGVPASGPMDRRAFSAANIALGNPWNQTGIEVSLAGLSLTCASGSVTIAVTGGGFALDINGAQLDNWCIATLHQGDRLTVRAGSSGSWAYIATAGELEVTRWLGSSATHSTSGFGGGMLRAGQKMVVQSAEVRADRVGEIPRPSPRGSGPIRAVLGPQDRWFAPETVARFTQTTFQVSDGYDRMGMRLSGAVLPPEGALSIPSEPVARGAVQVSGDGVPTVLLADHQTTGGYPKIATITSADLDRLAQARSGDPVAFEAIGPQDAVDLAREAALEVSAYLDMISEPRGTLEQRLLRENLEHGFLPE